MNGTHTSLTSVIWLAMFAVQAHASMDLLAGVEAGIDTDTSMTDADLERTQRILQSQVFSEPQSWSNSETGIGYQIVIRYPYIYGKMPCLAYELTIAQPGRQETKSVDACRNNRHEWISITPSRSVQN